RNRHQPSRAHPFMDGDNIELTCESCGTLHIAVRDDLKRTWARITRLQHKQSGAEGAHTKPTGAHNAPATGASRRPLFRIWLIQAARTAVSAQTWLTR